MFYRLLSLIRLTLIQCAKQRKVQLYIIWTFQITATVISVILSALFFINIGNISGDTINFFFFERTMTSIGAHSAIVFAFLIASYAIQNLNEIITDLLVSNLAVNTEQATIGEVLALLSQRKITIVRKSLYEFSKHNLSRAIKFDARSLTIITRSVVPSLMPTLTGILGVAILLVTAWQFGLLILLFVGVITYLNRQVIRRGEVVSANFEANNEAFTEQKDKALMAIIDDRLDETEFNTSEGEVSLERIGFSEKAQESYNDLRYRYMMNSISRALVLVFSLLTLTGATLISLEFSGPDQKAPDASLALSLSIIITVFSSLRPIMSAVANITKLGSQVERLLLFVTLLNEEPPKEQSHEVIYAEEDIHLVLDELRRVDNSKPVFLFAYKGLTRLTALHLCDKISIESGMPFEKLLPYIKIETETMTLEYLDQAESELDQVKGENDVDQSDDENIEANGQETNGKFEVRLFTANGYDKYRREQEAEKNEVIEREDEDNDVNVIEVEATVWGMEEAEPEEAPAMLLEEEDFEIESEQDETIGSSIPEGRLTEGLDIVFLNQRNAQNVVKRYNVSELWVLSADEFMYISTASFDPVTLVNRSKLMLEAG